MIVLRDEKRIARLARAAQIISLVGLLVLVAGLLIIFFSRDTRIFLFQLAALVIGFALSQVGLYLSHRYVRRPRPDQVLDKAAGKFARKDGRLYHYLLPAPHVLLLPTGVVVLLAKYQNGQISAHGDQWRQAGLGMRRYFGREGLGNPTREAEAMTAKVAALVKEAAPTADVPVLPAPHVLLLPAGVVVLLAKYQNGQISAHGDQWRQAGLGMRRYFGREGLGNPTREAEAMTAKVAALVKEAAPTADVPVLPVIVFTTQNIDNLDVKESRIPATHFSKLSAVLRQQTMGLKPLPRADYEAVRAAFDAKATHLLEETVDADA